MTARVDIQSIDGLPRARLPALVGALTLLVIAGPFIALAFATQWSNFHFAPGDVGSIGVSLGYSLISLALIVALGTPLAWWLARHSFPGKWVLEAIILLALLTPPLAMGILLTTLLGPYGPVGSLVARAGVELTNSGAAFVVAQFYGALPYYAVAARAAFEGVPRELEQIALTLGKSPWQAFWLVSMPLARLGLAAGIALAWVRALGEFGIVLILAYYPQGIPVKLWVNLQDIGLSAVYPLLWVFFLVAMPLPLIIGLASRRPGLF
jgi:molybdate/tungstate transport system permease protein